MHVEHLDKNNCVMQFKLCNLHAEESTVIALRGSGCHRQLQSGLANENVTQT